MLNPVASSAGLGLPNRTAEAAAALPAGAAAPNAKVEGGLPAGVVDPGPAGAPKLKPPVLAVAAGEPKVKVDPPPPPGVVGGC